MSTDILGITEITPSQGGKYATHNQGLRELEARLVRAVSRTTDAQPGSPSNGDVYIMTASASGADWGGYAAGDVAHYYSGAWHNYTATKEGVRLWVNDEDTVVVCDGAAGWATQASYMSIGDLSDVDLASPAVPEEGSVLAYDATGGQWYARLAFAPVVATADLPAADASQDGRLVIEDAGASNRNLIVYAGGQRFRIDGGAAF